MSDFIIKKAKQEDFEAIYPLLNELDPSLLKDDWKQLFLKHYNGAEDYFGFVAFIQNRVVGFIGLIFSARVIRDELVKMCNMTTWIVKKEYQKAGVGILLLQEIEKLKKYYTLTGLTGKKKVIPVLKMIGFNDLDTISKIIFPIPTLNLFLNKCSIESDPILLEGCLNAKDLSIYRDHVKFRNIHFIIKTKENYCYIIAKKARRKKLLLIEIHYISNFEEFMRYISQIRVMVCLYFRVFGLLIDERFLRGNKIEYSINCNTNKLYYSNVVDKDDITDNLYTELLILPI